MQILLPVDGIYFVRPYDLTTQSNSTEEHKLMSVGIGKRKRKWWISIGREAAKQRAKAASLVATETPLRKGHHRVRTKLKKNVEVVEYPDWEPSFSIPKTRGPGRPRTRTTR